MEVWCRVGPSNAFHCQGTRTRWRYQQCDLAAGCWEIQLVGRCASAVLQQLAGGLLPPADGTYDHHLNMAMALKAVFAPPLQRITAFVCMMDPRCAQSLSNMHSYELTMCTAIMHETWGPCARASQIHNSGRKRCDATCWLDHCGDQPHSVQRQAMRMMHSC